MDRLCDEVVQLIFYELHNPTPFTQICKRFYELSQDPYVRAHYFLTRHGRLHAMYWALGRGRVLTDKVIDILLSSGATLSRYLIQVAIHHYFRTTSHPFIKTTWSRTVPFPVFAYFLTVSAKMYGEIPLAKGEDDGSMFSSFLKESRLPAELKSVSWEEIRDILQVYKFIPFHIKDHLMAQFPLALSIEPRLLPLAVTNGFHMDSKYRDFVFRKMFEKPIPSPFVSTEGRMEAIVENVRELRRLDHSMFLSRTVAAEICMEAKTNEIAYAALKKLGQSGDLLFELPALVEDLIKLFLKTRSITNPSTTSVLRLLYADFPSQDSAVRLVLLLTVFVNASSSHHDRVSPASLKTKLESLGLAPLTRKDILDVLLNPFIEKFSSIVEYAKAHIGLSAKDIRALIEEVAVKCLEVGCKGKLLKRLVDAYPSLRNTIANVVVERYQLGLDDLPNHEDEDACRAYQARLCRDYSFPKPSGVERTLVPQDMDVVMRHGDVDEIDIDDDDEDELDELSDGEDETPGDELELGHIGQDTLSTMIHREEMSNRFSRRRSYYGYNYSETTGRMSYPADALQVGKWIKEQFGLKSNVTAVFMTHAVINDTLGVYLTYNDVGTDSHVPITLHHFKILAHLGRPIDWPMFHDIESGAEFFFTEDDYLNQQSKPKIKTEVKAETALINIPTAAIIDSTSNLDKSTEKKRPRRTAAVAIRSYAVPDSDDEDIADEVENTWAMHVDAKKRKVESNLQRWIKELSVLLKEEQRKYKEKKRAEKVASSDTKVRITKSEFFKSLASTLRTLRKIDLDKRRSLYGPDVAEVDFSSGDDDEYRIKNTRSSKRQRTGR